jgi:IS30 family transposase
MCEKSKPQFGSVVWELVDQLLLEDWSPEQISGWLDKEERVSISHEWIYQYVYRDKRQGGHLHTHLRCQKKRRKRYGSNDRRGQIKGRVSIDSRPSIVDERKRIGDWEMDTVIGKLGGAVLVTMVERLSRFCLVMWAPNKTAEAVEGAIVKALHPLADRVHTLTYDNGKEFAYHAKISKALQAEGFFAHPYHSWERGLNENTNGLIRQYLPKKSSFDSLTEENIITIKNKLNNRPRKCLGFKTPNQVFLGINPPVALAS